MTTHRLSTHYRLPNEGYVLVCSCGWSSNFTSITTYLAPAGAVHLRDVADGLEVP